MEGGNYLFVCAYRQRQAGVQTTPSNHLCETSIDRGVDRLICLCVDRTILVTCFPQPALSPAANLIVRGCLITVIVICYFKALTGQLSYILHCPYVRGLGCTCLQILNQLELEVAEGVWQSSAKVVRGVVQGKKYRPPHVF